MKIRVFASTLRTLSFYMYRGRGQQARPQTGNNFNFIFINLILADA